MIERFLTSPRLYWLFRIGWAERVIFLTLRFLTYRLWRDSKKLLDITLFGFDFSKWQGVIDFARVFVWGAKFIILRAAYGITRDEKFFEYMRTAPDYFAGRLSVYGYYNPFYDPIAQANKLLETISPFRHFIRRVWGDFEFTNTGNYSASSHWKRYAETIIAAGYPFGVYTRKTWWDLRVGNLAVWFSQFPVWAAQYAPWLTLIPKGWTKVDFWQRGTPAIGHDVGTTSLEVDYNIADDGFYASEYSGDGTVPPPNGGNMSQWYRATGNINIRQLPAQGAAQVTTGERYVLANDVVEVEVVQSGFAKLLRLYRNDVRKDLAPVAWCGTAYLRTTTYTPPDVEPPPDPDPEPNPTLPDRLWIGETPETAAWYRKEV
jgi:hypothetical protein